MKSTCRATSCICLLFAESCVSQMSQDSAVDTGTLERRLTMSMYSISCFGLRSPRSSVSLPTITRSMLGALRSSVSSALISSSFRFMSVDSQAPTVTVMACAWARLGTIDASDASAVSSEL